MRWPLTQPIPVTVQGALHTQTATTPALAEFSADGPITDHDARLAVALTSVSLAGFAPYLAQTLLPSVSGQAAAHARLDWSGAPEAPRLQLTLDTLTLDNLRLRESTDKTAGRAAGKSMPDAVALKRLALTDVKVDLLARTVELRKARLVEPVVAIARDAQGKLNVQGRFVQATNGKTPSTPRPAPQRRW